MRYSGQRELIQLQLKSSLCKKHFLYCFSIAGHREAKANSSWRLKGNWRTPKKIFITKKIYHQYILVKLYCRQLVCALCGQFMVTCTIYNQKFVITLPLCPYVGPLQADVTKLHMGDFMANKYITVLHYTMNADATIYKIWCQVAYISVDRDWVKTDCVSMLL